MSMWSRLKVAVFTASIVAAFLPWGGCLGGLSMNRIMQYVAIGSIFD